MKKTRTRTTKTGKVAALLLLALPGILTTPAFGDEKKPKPKPGFAVISGTVFRDPGFAFPGVEVLLEPNPEGKTSKKMKKMKAVTDSRGEVSFRVPAAAMRYTMSVQVKGFAAESRPVTISGEEHQDVYITLLPAPAKEDSP
ncbi:MAG: carboxypeptidase regulatory-like domain-containing protein [Candidatus Solibacter usitatus]|nr:carboxypeptidase regulatory-like domain-containing protein [Candidatus Solibacter usitatus]